MSQGAIAQKPAGDHSPLIIPIILCGGAGTRLWPASRPDTPKPFLPLVDGTSTFALTLALVSDAAIYAPPVVVTGFNHLHLVEDALARAGIKATIIVEPSPRDTAPAIAAAALVGAAIDPEASLLVLAADQVIRDTHKFAATVAVADQGAQMGRIVTFGIRPDHPATLYGYIKPGAAIAGTAVKAVDKFLEKPDEEKAKALVAAEYLWNAGIFLMRSATAIAELEQPNQRSRAPRAPPSLSGASTACFPSPPRRSCWRPRSPLTTPSWKRRIAPRLSRPTSTGRT